MDMNQYLEIFTEESKEHLQSLNESLLSLETNPNDKGVLNEIFRIAHTLKGMAATMGFMKVANLTHEMENLLHAIRSDEVTIDTELIDVLFECLDTLEAYINSIAEDGKEGNLDSTTLVMTLNKILNKKNDTLVTNNENELKSSGIAHNQYVMEVISKAMLDGLRAYDIKVSLSKDCMLKSARAFIVFNVLENHCEIIQSIPTVEDIEDEKFETDFSVTVITEVKEETLKKELLSISDIDTIIINPIAIDNEEVAITRFNDKEEDTFLKEDNPNNKLKGSKRETKQLGKTVRVDIDRLDNLMNLVSELIIIKTRMEDIGGGTEKQNMNEAIEYLQRITTSLHNAVMKVRMVPIERVFNRFPRMVRDLSKELGKAISLEMTGEETEVDRTVIDEIGDPLIHLIRNSIDHGIENPEERARLGKNETGIVTLKAYADGNSVVIEVQDDGGGINIEKIKRRAVEKGIITAENAEELSTQEAVDLLFDAGFSTAEEITDISGRGVGLDVVKTKIEAIGGNVEVESIQDNGTRFTIRLPLTLAIIQALLINLGNEIYAIPLSAIKEITPILSKDIRKVHSQEVVLFRNKTLPVIRLNKILGLASEEDKEELMAVIIKKGEKEAGLIIDNLIGQQEVVIKSLGKYLNGIKHLAGATILGNGTISLILDINSLI